MKDILFIDDDSSMKFIIDHFRLFHNSQYRIKRFVTDGLKALEALKQDHFDIVITDIKMPVVDGITLIKKMREKNDETFVIIESTYREFRLAQEAIRYRAVDYIEKPLTETKLKESLDRVNRLIRERSENEKNKGRFWTKQIVHGLIYDESIQIQRSMAEFHENKKEILTNLNIKDEYHLSQFLWKYILREKKYIYNDRVFINLSQYQIEETIVVIRRELKRLNDINHDGFILKLSKIISDHLTSAELISVISEELELSKDYISRTFRQKTGLTLKDFIILRKIVQAQAMLSHSNKKVYEISNYLGYSSVDYFTKVYKKVSGRTPMQYRKLYM